MSKLQVVQEFRGLAVVLTLIMIPWSIVTLTGTVRDVGASYAKLVEAQSVSELVNREEVDEAKLQREALRRIYGKVRSFRPGLSDGLIYRISGAVYEASRQYKIDEDIILSVIRVESYFDPSAVSVTGARGLMQLMPLWSKVLPDCKDLFDIRVNVRCGTQVFLIYFEQYDDVDTALAAYNRGPRYVNRDILKGVSPVQKYTTDVLMYVNQLKSWSDPNAAVISVLSSK